jgi:hypothetical protein
MHLSHVNKPNREEDTHHDTDGKHSEQDCGSFAPLDGIASHDLSMAERQSLCDAVSVRRCEPQRLSQRAADSVVLI